MEELKKTPLYEAHIAHGGQMVDFGGWALPVRYSGDKKEHNAVRENVGIFDVSHMGEIDVEGPGCYDYLQNLVTNDITSMTDGRVRYTTVAYETGFTVDDVLIYKYNDTHYLLVVNASNTDKDYAWFVKNAEGYDVKLKNISADIAQIALQGPNYLKVMENLKVEGELPTKYYTFVDGIKINGIKCLVSRTGYTGELGLELYCAKEDGLALYNAIFEAGEPVGLLPCGLGARDSLRFEAGMPLYGHEIDEDITPMEADLTFAVKLKKEKFNGKAVLEQPRKRVRIGLKLVDRGIARAHDKVFCNGKEVGYVTTGLPSPTLGVSIADALICTCCENEENFEIEVRGKMLKAEKTSYFFVESHR